jgi:hypothetical protein
LDLNLAQNNIDHFDVAYNALFSMYHDEDTPFDQIKAFYNVEHLDLLTTEMTIDAISRFRPQLTKVVKRRNPHFNIIR